MKTSLPISTKFSLNKTSKNSKGFTLVELLVVITIITILAVVGLTLFGGAQKNARDARRRADVNAIANAIELKKTSGVAYYDANISNSDFSSGVIPAETYNTSSYKAKYVIDTVCQDTAPSSVTPPAAPTVWAATTASGLPTTPSTYTEVVYSATPANNSPIRGCATKIWAFRVCALLESGTAPNVYCKASAQ